MIAPNPILKEIYAARDEILAEYDGDLGAYIHSAQQRALASGHPMSHRRQYSVRTRYVVRRFDQKAGIRCHIDGDTPYELAHTPRAIRRRGPQRISRTGLGIADSRVARPTLGVQATKAHTVWLG